MQVNTEKLKWISWLRSNLLEKSLTCRHPLGPIHTVTSFFQVKIIRSLGFINYNRNEMAVLCGMSTIQYSAHRYIIYCLSPFRNVAVLTFAVLVCRRFDHTPTSSGHAHLDRQRYDRACHSWTSVERRNNLVEVSCTERTILGNEFELTQR